MYKVGRHKVKVLRWSRFKSAFVEYLTGPSKGTCKWIEVEKLTKT
jgi:hypothetical protein